VNKKLIGAGGVVLLAVIAYAGYGRITGGAADDTPTETATVRRGALEVTVSATGSVVPHAVLSLAFPAGGRVAEVLVEEGQQVAAGDPLARLDTDVLALQLASAEASSASARASLSSAQRSLDLLLEGPSETDVEMARLDVAQAKDSLWSVQSRRDSTCGRVDAGRGEQAECDSAEASVLQGESSVRIAEIQYEEAIAGPTEEEVADARDKVIQAQAQVESSEVQLAQAELNLEQATLTAPMAGTITAVDVQPGAHIGSGQQVAVLSDLANLAVDINLDETDVARVSIGMDAGVGLDAFPGAQLAGEVASIASVAQTEAGVVLYPVTVRLNPTDLPVRAGMTADVNIVAASAADALIVPLRAVRTFDGISYVQRLATGVQRPSGGMQHAPGGVPPSSEGTGQRPEGMGRRPEGMGQRPAGMRQRQGDMQHPEGVELPDTGQMQQVEVTLGLMTDTEVEITGGLAEGDVVAVVATSGSVQRMQMRGRSVPFGGMFRH